MNWLIKKPPLKHEAMIQLAVGSMPTRVMCIIFRQLFSGSIGQIRRSAGFMQRKFHIFLPDLDPLMYEWTSCHCVTCNSVEGLNSELQEEDKVWHSALCSRPEPVISDHINTPAGPAASATSQENTWVNLIIIYKHINFETDCACSLPKRAAINKRKRRNTSKTQ